MLLSQLIPLLSLLSGTWLSTGWGRPGPWDSPLQSWAVANQTSPVPISALSSWQVFLNLQKSAQWEARRLQHRQEVTAPVSLPLDPEEMTQEICKAVPFTQVLSRPGCTAIRLRNHLCFGHCSSIYVPGSGPAPLVLCSSCVPTHQRRAPVVLWCWAGGRAVRRRVKTTTVLVEGCHCNLKA
ncbi:DAN domain family member 5 [Talpa occidentalis]|uniref:DAN domain family member 5 n=1 Tax=Talpa occidentalis TaxID=50954 RepID=UPI00188EE000|nr:DAN domain family member 5 [Talpa occidentalis]